MDIALIIGDLGAGGSQRVLSNLANAWTRSGRKVCLITMESVEHDFYPLDPAVQRVSIGGLGNSTHILSAIFANFRRISTIRKAIRETGAPVVVSFLGATNILTILATIGLRLRVVISERNDPKCQSLGRAWDILRFLLYRFADMVTANSHGNIESLTAYVPKRKLAYVPNLLVVPPKDESVSFDRKTIIASGRLSPVKAYDVLLDAFARIAPQNPDWQLVIIGDGPERESLIERTHRLGLMDHVFFKGRVDNPFSYYWAGEIFAHPSRFEGYPNALIEAMACGLAPIVSDASPGPLELVDGKTTGLIAPVNDIEAFADLLLRLIQNPELREQIGIAARERVAEFDPVNALPVWNRVVGLE